MFDIQETVCCRGIGASLPKEGLGENAEAARTQRIVLEP